jgi:spore germination protein YaaH
VTRPNVGLKDEEAMYLDAVALAKQYHAPIHFDESGQSHWFTYTDASTGIKRTVWFESHFGFCSRWELAKQYKVAGISLWRIGGEDPELWKYPRIDRTNLVQPPDPNYPKGKSGPSFGIDLIISL